ncbi:MAG: hypothetical protein HHAS10_10070 [Candidatus Altimarinota bacterium]
MIAAKSIASDRVSEGAVAQMALPSNFRAQKFYQTSGFQIFLLLTITVLGVILFWWIKHKSSSKNNPER